MLSDDNQVPPHKQGLRHQNAENEQLTISSEKVTMSEAEKSAGMPGYSETKGNVSELTYNGSDHRASHEEYLKRKAGKDTFGRDNKHDAENSESFLLSLTNSLGADCEVFLQFNSF